MSKIKEFISQQGELRDFQGEIVRMCSEHTLITRPQFQKLMAEGDKLVTHGLISIENMGALECELVGSVNIQATATLLVARCHGGVLTTRHYQNAIKYGTPKQRRQYEKTACVPFDTEKKLSFLVSEGVATMEEVAHLADIFNKVALIETSNAKSCLLVLGRYFTIQGNGSVKDARMLDEGHEEFGNTKYNDILKLLKNRTDLLKELLVSSDDGIVHKLKQWSKKTDNLGRPLIENPDNNLKKAYAEALNKAGLIKCSVNRFRQKL